MPPAAGSGDLNTFQLAACCFRSGFSLFCRASFNFATTSFKVRGLVGLYEALENHAGFVRTRNTRVVGAAWACRADTVLAESAPATSALRRPSRPGPGHAGVAGDRNIAASFGESGCYFSALSDEAPTALSNDRCLTS